MKKINKIIRCLLCSIIYSIICFGNIVTVNARDIFKKKINSTDYDIYQVKFPSLNSIIKYNNITLADLSSNNLMIQDKENINAYRHILSYKVNDVGKFNGNFRGTWLYVCEFYESVLMS